MARNETFFQRLTHLFRSGPSIRRRVKGQDYRSYYDTKLIQGNYGYQAPAPFGFGRESSPFSVLGSYGIMDRMARYCLAGDMRIATNTPEGSIALKELVEHYNKNPEKKYYTFSYDDKADEIVCAPIKHAFFTKVDEIVEVHLDSGAVIRCTKEHPLMLRDGTYCEAKDLKPNMALMPFYRKTLQKYSRYNKNRYRSIYSFSEKWKSEHKIVAEYKKGKKILPEHGLHIHHKNYIGNDNRVENLEIMPAEEHLALHANDASHSSRRISKRHHINLIENSAKIKKIKNRKYNNGRSLHKKIIKSKNHSKSQFTNANCDKDFTIETIKNNWEKDISAYKLAKKCGVHYGKFNSRLKWAGYESYVDFVQKNFNPSYNKTYKKPRHLFDLPKIQDVYNNYTKKTTCTKLAKKLNISPEMLLTILRRNDYISWYDFCERYKNHKVSKVVFTGIKEKVYDITVEPHHNFAVYDATGKSSIISHNSEFSEMEYTPELAAALDIYADETVGGDDRGRNFHIYSKDINIKKHLDELFYDVLNVEFNLRAWARNLVKYGDFFLYNEVLPEVGVINAQPIPVNEIEREEGFDEDDPYAVRFKWLTRGNVYLENWQVTHMRILGNDLFLPYGTAVLEPARRIWRQLIMMEDAMLVYRVVRSPERRVFYIDVAGISPNDIPSFMEATKSTLRSHSVIEKSTGRSDMRYNPLAVDEDYYIPVRGSQTGTKIDTLAGGQHVTATEDVQYIQSKLFAAIKVPKPYLNYDENLSSKATLAQTDVRFSKTINGIQKIIISEMNKLAMLHLFAKGFDGEDLINFELKLSNPSSVAVQQKLELWATKADVAGTLKDTGLVDESWVQRNILELTEDDVAAIDKGLYQDRIKEMQLDSVAFEEEQEQNTTTDTFSPANYNMGGGDVSKGPPPDGDRNSVNYSNSKKRQYGSNIVGPDNKSNPFKINYAKGSTPIKATPFLTRNRKNRIRRVGQGGRENLANPDFSSMLNPSKNKSLKDIFDMDFLKNPYKREGVEGKSNFLKIDNNVTLARHIQSALDRFSEYYKTKDKNSKLLTEEIDLEIEEDEEEEILNFVVEDEIENSPFKEGKSSFKDMMDDEYKEDEKDSAETIDIDIE